MECCMCRQGAMTVTKIVRKYLSENGFDGLYNADAECGCRIDDLAPCGEPIGECRPGYSGPGSEGSSFNIYGNKADRDEAARRPK